MFRPTNRFSLPASFSSSSLTLLTSLSLLLFFFSGVALLSSNCLITEIAVPPVSDKSNNQQIDCVDLQHVLDKRRLDAFEFPIELPLESPTPEVPKSPTPDTSVSPTPDVTKSPSPDAPVSLTPDVPKSLTPDVPKLPILDAAVSSTPHVPKSATPDAPVSTIPNVLESPTPDVPKSPTPDVPGLLTPDVPKSPTPDVPKSPTLDVPKSPTPYAPVSPTPDVPKSPTPDAPVSSTPDVPESPTPNVLKSQTENLPLSTVHDVEPESFPYHYKIHGSSSGDFNLPATKNRRSDNSEGSCTLSLEILYLQDLTVSMQNIAKQAPTFLSSVDSALKGLFNETYFGVASFKDKPIEELGDTNDYCFKLDFPMDSSPLLDRLQLSIDLSTATGKTNQSHSDATVIAQPTNQEFKPTNLKLNNVSIDNLFVASGGGDWFDNQFGAMVRAGVSANYTSAGRLSKDGNRILRLLLLSTDSPPHIRGDAFRAIQLRQPDTMTMDSNFDSNDAVDDVNSIFFEKSLNQETHLKLDGNFGCETADYPSLQQLKEVLKAQLIRPVFLVSSPAGAATVRMAEQQQLWEKQNRVANRVHSGEGLKREYERLMERADLDAIVTVMEDEKRDILKAIFDAVRKWGSEACGEAVQAFTYQEMSSRTSSDGVRDGTDATTHLRAENGLTIFGGDGSKPEWHQFNNQRQQRPEWQRQTTTTTTTTTPLPLSSNASSPIITDPQPPSDASNSGASIPGIIAVGSASALTAYLALKIGLLIRRKTGSSFVLASNACFESNAPELPQDRDASSSITPSLYA